MNRQLINGDWLEELKKLDDNSVDLLCTDPPYGYGFMGKHWDTFKEKDSTKSQQVGWMSPGMKKDTYGMKEFFEPIWTECLRVLKPGALAFVMSAPRSDVQTIMSQTLRDAGFDISFTPIYWTYASGFPKAMNMGKMLDKKYGNKREEVEEEHWGRKNRSKEYSANVFTGDRINDETSGKRTISKGSSELEGSYGGFQPKPAVEVVLVAMKPIEEKGLLAQAEKNGKAITWFDDCRIPFEEGYVEPENQTMPDLRDVGKKSKEAIGIDKLSYGQVQNAKRKPYKSDYQKYVEKQKSFANAKTIGTTIKGNEHFLGGDIKQLNPAENYQKPKTTKRKPREDGTVFKTSGFKSENNDTAEASPMGRFPANLLVSDNVLDDGTEKKKLSTKGATLKTMTAPDLRDVGKKSKEAIGIDKLSYGQVQNAERVEYEQWEVDETTNGYSRFFSLDNWFTKNIKLLPEAVQKTFPFLIVPKASKSEKNDGLELMEEKKSGAYVGRGGTQEDPNGMFKDRDSKSRNIHPTVKPLTLMNYLVTLGSRKGDVVLDPFMGSGTTPLACVSLERKYIGIDNEEDYYKIAKARVDKLEAPIKAWEKFI